MGSGATPRLKGMNGSTWLWTVLVVAVVLLGAAMVVRTVRANNAKLFSAQATPERARRAADRLTEEQHRAVHRHLATGAVLAAAQEIARATGSGVRESMLDAYALAQHPQVWRAPEAGSGEGPAGQGPADRGQTGQGPDAARGAEAGRDPLRNGHESGAGQDRHESRERREDRERQDGNGPEASMDQHAAGEHPDDDRDETAATSGASDRPGPEEALQEAVASEGEEWVVPAGWEETYGGDHAGERHMEFTHHDGTELRRFSTQDLPDAERDQLMSQLRDGDLASAAKIISEAVGLGQAEVENALRANHESGHDQVDGIAVRFDRGDGTSVDFSTEDLPGPEKEAFVAALRSGDLVSAAQVVARHTGISPEQALGLLEAFRRES